MKYSSSIEPDVVEPVERPGRNDHERRDLSTLLVKERVVLERRVEVGLAIEDGDGDVVPVGQERLELDRAG